MKIGGSQCDLKLVDETIKSKTSARTVGKPSLKGIDCEEITKNPKKKTKGHVPIRSQTGHDHEKKKKKH